MKTIKLFYADIPNFGDQLSKIMLERLFACPVVWADVKTCDMVAIGSVLNTFFKKQLACLLPQKYSVKTPLSVWGSGFIKAHRPWHSDQFIRPIACTALRGRVSLERMRALGVACESIALGDPGLLAGQLWKKSASASECIGILPHYTDMNHPLIARVCAAVPHAQLISPCDSPDTVINAVARCSFLFSSSMHGLIVADALGIPNLRMTLADHIIGGDYKFEDYYSVFETPMPSPWTVNVQTLCEAKQRMNATCETFVDKRAQIDVIGAALCRAFAHN